MLITILLVILVLALIGSAPGGPGPWAANWGWGPSGLIGTLLIVLLILVVLGRA